MTGTRNPDESMTDDAVPAPPGVVRADTNAATVPAPDRPAFDRRMLEALVCPVSQTTLAYDAESQELVSERANLAFPIRGGIPIMLVSEARTLD